MQWIPVFIDKEILDWRQVVRQSMPWNRRHWMGQSTVVCMVCNVSRSGTHTHTINHNQIFGYTRTKGYDRLWLWGGIMCQILGPPVAFRSLSGSSLSWSELLGTAHLAMYRWTCGQVIYAEVFVEASEPSRGPVIQTLMHILHIYIYCIFIEYSYNSTNTPMFWYQDWGGQVDPVDIVLRGIGYVEEMQEVTTSEDPTNINNINKHQSNINKHQQTSTNTNKL